MEQIPVTEARAQLSDLVSKVAFGGEPVLLTRHGKPLVALVPASSLNDFAAVSDETTSQSASVILDLTNQRGDRHGYTIAARHRDSD